MKTFLLILLITTSAAAQSQEVLVVPPPTEIRLTNGFVMRGCKIVAWGDDVLTIQYVGGTVPVRLANINKEDRAAIEKSKPGEVMRLNLEAARAHRSPPEWQPPAPKSADGDPEAAQRKADEIKHGVFFHHLVAGMNAAQVKEAMGSSPTETYGDSSGAMTWIYARRGKDYVTGTIGDKQLYFVNGILTRWEH